MSHNGPIFTIMRHQPTMHITRTTMLLLQQLAQKIVLLNDVDFFSKTRETRVSKSNNWSPYCGQLGTMRLLVGSDQGGAVRGCKRVNRCHYHRTQLERMACLDVSTAAIPDRVRRFVPGHLYLDHSCHPAHPCTVR